jgi:hypothetical protein
MCRFGALIVFERGQYDISQSMLSFQFIPESLSMGLGVTGSGYGLIVTGHFLERFAASL